MENDPPTLARTDLRNGRVAPFGLEKNNVINEITDVEILVNAKDETHRELASMINHESQTRPISSESQKNNKNI